MAAVRFKVRITEVVVEEGVVLQPRAFDLLRREIQQLRKHAKCFLLIQDAHGQKVTDLHDKAANLLQEDRLGLCEFTLVKHNVLFGRKPGPKFPQHLERLFGES